MLNLACIYVCVYCILSEYYSTKASVMITEVVNSYFHLYGCGYSHNRIDDVPLTTGTLVVVYGVVEVYLGIMIEARRDGCNCWTTGVYCFIGLDLWLVSPVTLLLSSHYCYIINVLIRLK
jgi:hypothetical protein